MIKKYRENCLPAGSEEMRRIRAAARDNGIFVSLGFSEIDMATCFISQVMISPTGEAINFRRKIKPTHVEKLIYGDGSGDTFETVMDTEIGRLGQFNCWENTNPFLRACESCSFNSMLQELSLVSLWTISATSPQPRLLFLPRC